MNGKIFTQEEILKAGEVSAEVFQKWRTLRLVKPVGFSDSRAPLYSEITLARIAQIRKLIELGYELPEIQKIIRKVGLPKSAKTAPAAEDIDRYLTVGTLAEKAGVSSRTIKHWEDKGIIEPEMRSEGGFRLYPKIYIYFCKLIKDLQLFGYTLEEIKTISDYFRDFQAFKAEMTGFTKEMVSEKVDSMLKEIESLKEKMNLLKEGIQRWEDLVKKNRREIVNLRNLNAKRNDNPKEPHYE